MKPNPRIKVLEVIGHLTVWEVDGFVVRDELDIDFTTGGNAERYPYIPKDEVWIDNSHPEERKFNILHELRERRFMKDDGLSYDPAHERTNRVERKARNDASIVDRLLDEERDAIRAEGMASDEGSDRFVYGPDSLRILHVGTEEAPDPSDEVEEGEVPVTRTVDLYQVP